MYIWLVLKVLVYILWDGLQDMCGKSQVFYSHDLHAHVYVHSNSFLRAVKAGCPCSHFCGSTIVFYVMKMYELDQCAPSILILPPIFPFSIVYFLFFLSLSCTCTSTVHMFIYMSVYTCMYVCDAVGLYVRLFNWNSLHQAYCC